jgi:hypothetical protein
MQRADAERGRGELQTALDGYREVLAIDSSWEPARVAIGEIGGALQDAELGRLMSLGFSSLAARFPAPSSTSAQLSRFGRQRVQPKTG